jgi:subtilisin family serine protease
VSTPIPGHYIVVFKKTVVNASLMATTLATQHQRNADHVYKSALKGMAIALTPAEAAAMRADPSVAYVEQDQLMALQSTQSNAPWGIDRIDQRALPLTGSYVYNADGSGVTVYIIDTGINYTHVEFGGRAVKGIDIYTPGGTAEDCQGHGTANASIAGGATLGVAKHVRLVAVRVGNCAAGMSTSNTIAGVDWVTANRTLPAVANMSIAVGLSAALNQAVENSIATGVVYVAAAGNNNFDACQLSPASAPDVITVGSTNSSDVFSYFSNWGPCVALSAPGEVISMAWVGSTTATNVAGGTSYASPHVAGIAALYLHAHPTATPYQVRAAILANATANALTSVPANTPNLLAYSGFISAGTAFTVADFTSNCPTVACSFDASISTALPSATYGWTFGDGSNGTGKSPSHTFAATGTYGVTLTVTDANGTSTKTRTVTMAVANQPPVARFTSTCPTLQCTFNASTSSDDVGIMSYAWTWGNSRGETHTGATSTNTYAMAGTYAVTLKVTDGSGQTNSLTKSVVVPTATVGNQSPTAAISSPSNGLIAMQGASILFVGAGTDPEEGALAGSSLTWTSSRDGQIGTGTSFSTSTLSAGSHLITLTSTDAQGLTGTSTLSITIRAIVNQAPVASFTWSCTGFVLHQCRVNASASTDDFAVVSYSWDWGNGSSETHAVSSSSNTWATAGNFNVTLTVKDASGLTSTIMHTVTAP